MTLRIAACACLLAGPATAGGPIAEILCAPRPELETRLTRDFHATLAGFGLRDAEAVMEIWADPSGRWTLVQRYANGISCILAMGADWVEVRAEG